MADIPYLSVTFTETNTEALHAIVGAAKPDWDNDQLIVELIPKGLLNKIWRVYQRDRREQSIIIKTQVQFFLGSVKDTHSVNLFLTEQGLSCDMLVFFDNGVCMDFVNGEPSEWNSGLLKDGDVMEQVAAEMAQWHDREVLERAREQGVRTVSVLLGDVEKYWDTIMSRKPMIKHKDDFPTKEELLNVERSLIQEMMLHGELEEALCHNDVNGSNIIIQRTGVKFIDYDFVGINFVQNEIAWFFLSFMDMSDPNFDHVPDEDSQKRFLDHYLSVRRRLEPGACPDTDVESLYRQVQMSALLVHLRLMATAFVCDMTGNDSLVPLAKYLWKNFAETKRSLTERFRLT